MNFTELSEWMNVNKPCLDAPTQGKARESPGAKSNLTLEESLYFEFCLSSALSCSCSDREVWSFLQQAGVIWGAVTRWKKSHKKEKVLYFSYGQGSITLPLIIADSRECRKRWSDQLSGDCI